MNSNPSWPLLMASANAKPRPTIVGTTSATSTGAGTTSLTLTVPSGVQNGDLLIAVVCAAQTTVTDWTQASFTWAVKDGGTIPCVGVAYRVASSEPASYNFTITNGGGSRIGGGMLAYRGASWDTVGAITLTETPSGITVAEANSILLGYWANSSGTQTFGTPSGMSATGATFTGSTNPNWVVFSENVNAGATGATRTSTSTGSNDGSVLFSIKPF